MTRRLPPLTDPITGITLPGYVPGVYAPGTVEDPYDIGVVFRTEVIESGSGNTGGKPREGWLWWALAVLALLAIVSKGSER